MAGRSAAERTAFGFDLATGCMRAAKVYPVREHEGGVQIAVVRPATRRNGRAVLDVPERVAWRSPSCSLACQLKP